MFDSTNKIHHLPNHQDQQPFFQLHVDHSHSGHQASHEAHHKAMAIVDSSEEKTKRTLKSIFHDAGRQIFASIIFLVIGFLLLNWSAYYQIGKSRWENLIGTHDNSPLQHLIEEEDMFPMGEEVSTNGIPPLDMEITPLDDRLIIPRINQNIPVIRVSSEALLKKDWSGLEAEMQKALQDGVVHYPGTSLPGQTGNVVITGHSSYFPWDPGRFKDVFALLHDVVVGDKIVVYYKQDKYLYEVDEIKIVLPEDISVLKQTPQNKLTLITCTPVGTNLKRLIVTAVPVAKNNQPIENNNTKISR